MAPPLSLARPRPFQTERAFYFALCLGLNTLTEPYRWAVGAKTISPLHYKAHDWPKDGHQKFTLDTQYYF